MLSEGQPLLDAHAATIDELEAKADWIQDSLRAMFKSHAPGKVTGGSASFARWRIHAEVRVINSRTAAYQKQQHEEL